MIETNAVCIALSHCLRDFARVLCWIFWCHCVYFSEGKVHALRIKHHHDECCAERAVLSVRDNTRCRALDPNNFNLAWLENATEGFVQKPEKSSSTRRPKNQTKNVVASFLVFDDVFRTSDALGDSFLTFREVTELPL